MPKKTLPRKKILNNNFGSKGYITQPNNYKEIMRGELVIAPNFPYKRRFQ